MKQPDAIFISDIHLREDTPICRTDNYQEAQWKKIKAVKDLQNKFNRSIYCAGDVFNKARSSKLLDIQAIENIFYMDVITGNHDLPYHKTEHYPDSSLALLEVATDYNVNVAITELEEFAEYDIHIPGSTKSRTLGVIHKLIHNGKPIKAEGKAISTSAKKILKDNPQFDVILSGDNHHTFTAEYEGRLLVNPGSVMRMTADQTEHEPCVFLYYAEDNSVEKVLLPFEKNVISREHIEKKEEYDDRLTTFISSIDQDMSFSIDFIANINTYLKLHKTKKEVKEIVFECTGE